ncbi:MAG: DEAD/DEAH box helicase [Candidatus Limnocylindrales bacterium]
MSYELRQFQEEAVDELLGFVSQAREAYQHARVRSAIGLTATTGAGKTVIASALIDAILFGSDRFATIADPNAIFLWMTDLPELNAQTQEKMRLATSRLRYDLLPIIDNTYNEETLSPGRVYFMNTQLLSKSGLLTKAGPTLKRDFTFWDVIRRTVDDPDGTGRTLYLIVDEAHRGMTEGREAAEANSIIQRFIKGYPEQRLTPVPVVLGISATPQRFLDLVAKTGRATFQHDVSAERVRASGLIKVKTRAEYAGETQTDAMAVFPVAVKTWKDATEAWAAYHACYPNPGGEPTVVPALVIQVENVGHGAVSQTDLGKLIGIVGEIAGPLPDDAFVQAFGEHADLLVGDHVIRYLDPSKIAGDTDAQVVFYKDALGTGWDCPRAEVMFSFRRAADTTSIAQTIGRMVRAPLARKIEENEVLNACWVFLPHYNRRAVEEVIAYLHHSGNQAIAETFELGSASVTLPLRDRPEAIVAISRVPTYVVPVSPTRSAARFLAKMARFLSSSGIDAPAKQREANDGAELLLERQRALAKDTGFMHEVDENGEIVTEIAEALTGETKLSPGSTRRLQATDLAIDREFALARSKLTAEVADAYVVKRHVEGASIRQAKLEARALANREGVLGKLEQWALGRIDSLRQQHGAEIESLSPAARSRYFDGILAQAPDPTVRDMSLPSNADFRRGDLVVPRHLYGLPDSGPGMSFGSTWETDTLVEELANEAVVAWLRNVERAPWALRIPRREGNAWRPFFPDFMLVRRDGERLVVDILDPHDHTKPDAVSKAKGLSAYARTHAEKLGHVDLIAKIGTRYRRLHLEREAVRKHVDSLSDGGQKELEALFGQEP